MCIPLRAPAVSRGEAFLDVTGVSVPVWENRYGREHQQARLVLGDSFGVEQFVFIHLRACVCVCV